ncbi:Ca2+-binding RTX toxin-like protein [Microvirga lupini]|uniref:Ca2+-binding RTX toxin-like protein n=1 Tax=Microvirga lupini TaxID=420324 RepID=A0A7W4VP30_9HYPH|nr:Ca2+-binding RTX toxin-like protein [Microvirga lupini]
MAFKTQSFKYSYQGTIFSFGTGDFNGDGSLDLIFGGPTTPFENKPMPFNAISVSKKGVITNITTKLFATTPYAVQASEGVVADFNGDGVDDFFSGNFGYDSHPFPGEYNTLMLSGPGGKLYDGSSELPLNFDGEPDLVHTATAADIDNDGDQDILSGDLNLPFIMRNDGKGNFKADYNSMPGAGAYGGDDRMISECKFVDINNDGWRDLITVYADRGSVAGHTFLNNGAGVFARSGETALPVGIYGAQNTNVVDVLDLDINGDGFMDLVLAATPGKPYYQGQKVQILINNTDGTFHDESSRIKQDGKGFWFQEIEAIDYNGDGFMDLVGTSDYSETKKQTIVWINNGSGRFTPLPKSDLNGFESSIIPLDFNKDGNMDFLSFRQEGNYFTSNGKWVFKTHLNVWNTIKLTNRNDTKTGTKDRDLMYGYEGNDVLKGGSGNDNIQGGSGRDKLYGGVGRDALSGGSGADVFVFQSIADSTLSAARQDTLYDFSGRAGDKIDLKAIDAKVGISGNQAFTFIGQQAFRQNVGELRYEKVSGGASIIGDVNGDGSEDFAIYLKGVSTLSKGYFIL